MSRQSSTVPRRRWYHKAALGLVVALGLLGLAEGVAQLVSLVSGKDFRIDSLPQLRQYEVLCPAPPQVRLCPDQGQRYDRVRPLTFASQPRPGTHRVITIGESFVFGLGLDLEQAWPAQLERALGPGVEVLNLGRCGTHAGLQHGIVEAAVSLKPELLVLAMGNNEHTMTTFYVGWAGRHPVMVFNMLDFLSRFQLAGQVNTVLGSPVRLQVEWDVTRKQFDNPVDQRIYAARRRPPDLSWFKGRLASYEVTRALTGEMRLKEQVYRRHLQEMIDYALDQGVKVLLATLPNQLGRAPELSGCHVDDPAVCRRLEGLLAQLREQRTPNKDALIQQAMALDDKLAGVHYARGMALLARQEREEAVAALRRSVSFDLLPDNTPAINEIIRELAEDNDLPLVDLNAWSATLTGDPRARDLFMDRVHMSARGSEEVARLVAAKAGELLGVASAAKAGP